MSSAANEPRPTLFDDDASTEPSTADWWRDRWPIWVGVALFSLGLGILVYLDVAARRSPEEIAAIDAAVSHYSSLFKESPAKIHRLHKIDTKRLADGAWRVEIIRVIVPDPQAGYEFTSEFQVDRDGNCKYLGQREGRPKTAVEK